MAQGATGSTTGTESQAVTRSDDGPLGTEQGRTTIADGVVTKVASLAAREVAGVHELGGPDVVSYDDLLTETMRGYRKRRPRLHLPVPLMKPAAVVMGLVMSDPPVTLPQLDLLKTDNVPARNDIEQVFGIVPRPFRGGLGYLSRG